MVYCQGRTSHYIHFCLQSVIAETSGMFTRGRKLKHVNLHPTFLWFNCNKMLAVFLQFRQCEAWLSPKKPTCTELTKNAKTISEPFLFYPSQNKFTLFTKMYAVFYSSLSVK